MRWIVSVGCVIFILGMVHATLTTTTMSWIVLASKGHTVTYGGACDTNHFYFNEINAIFDPDTDGNAAKVIPTSVKASDPLAQSTVSETFSGITNPSSTHVAYADNISDSPPSANNTPDQEIDSADYPNITDLDATYHLAENNTDLYPSLKLFFLIEDVDLSLITDLNFMYTGRGQWGGGVSGCAGTADQDVYVYIWNYTLSSYQQLYQHLGTGGTSNADFTAGQSLTTFAPYTLSNYMNSNGEVIILIQGRIGDQGRISCLYTDQAYLDVYYYVATGGACQSQFLAPMTITNVGTESLNLDGNFTSAFTLNDKNVVLKVWKGTDTGCGSSGFGGWEKDCSVTGATSPVTTTTCRNYNSSNATTAGRLVTALEARDTNQLCFSGDLNTIVTAGSHVKTFQTGS